MKAFLCLFVLLFFNFGFSQKETVRVVKITTDEKVFSAVIDEKYSVTIYLKLFKFSDDHQGIYSVKGWYYYDKIKTKIPLVGIYNTNLTLFSFKSKEEKNKILNFDAEDGYNIFDKVELLKRSTGFEERFSLDIIDNKLTGKWMSKSKELNVRLADENLDIYHQIEYLQIQDGEKIKRINLYNLALFETGFEVISFAKTTNQINILLSYEYVSRPYAQGMCGGGLEVGFAELTFDLDYSLLATNLIETDSCLNQISSEVDEKNQNKITVYEGTDDIQKTQFIIDKKNAKIIRL